MRTSHDDVDPATTARDEDEDDRLLSAVRRGDAPAYAELYTRHVGAARAVARRVSRSPHDVEDHVAEAFANVLAAVCTGGGPERSFRPYLLRTVRNVATTEVRRRVRCQPSDDLDEHCAGALDAVDDEVTLGGWVVADAFRSLPERWRTVLWYTAVEGRRPAAVGELMGTSATSVTSLAHRARHGLRSAHRERVGRVPA